MKAKQTTLEDLVSQTKSNLVLEHGEDEGLLNGEVTTNLASFGAGLEGCCYAQ